MFIDLTSHILKLLMLMAHYGYKTAGLWRTCDKHPWRVRGFSAGISSHSPGVNADYYCSSTKIK